MEPKPPAPVIKPSHIRDSKNRVRVVYKGRTMMPFRAVRLAALEPLINRANARRMDIQKAAEWLCISESGLRQFIAILGIKWRCKLRQRTVFKHDRTGWDERIVAGLREGKAITAISKELGVGHWMVSRYIKEQGLWAVVLNKEPRDR